MTPELRRGLAALLAGTAASLVALLTSAWLRARACAAAGGQWLEAARECRLPTGAAPPSSWLSSLIGTLAGVVTLIVLWRTFTFFADRARRGGTATATPAGPPAERTDAAR